MLLIIYQVRRGCHASLLAPFSRRCAAAGTRGACPAVVVAGGESARRSGYTRRPWVRAAALLVGSCSGARRREFSFRLHGERQADRRADAGGRRTARALPAVADRLGVAPGSGDPPGAPGAVYPPRNRTLAGSADGTAARPRAGADRQRPDLAAQLRALPDGAPRVAPRARGDHAGAGAHGRRRRAVPGDRSPRLPGPSRGESQARPPARR
jgi:hypothetical protein